MAGFREKMRRKREAQAKAIVPPTVEVVEDEEVANPQEETQVDLTKGLPETEPKKKARKRISRKNLKTNKKK